MATQGFGVGVDLGGMTPQLKSVTIDPGSSFLNGGATSLFGGGKVMPVDPKQLLGQLPNPVELASQITLKVVDDVTTFASSYLGEKLAECMLPPNPGDIIALAQSYFTDKVYTPAYLLKLVSEDKDVQQEKKANEELANKVKEVKSQVDKKIGYMKDKVGGVLSYVQTGISYIGYFVTQGPKWVENQANMIDKKAKDEIAKFVYTQAKVILDKKEEFTIGAAKKYAQMLADAVNNKTQDEVYNTLKQVMLLKEKTLGKAKAVAKEAILQLMSLIGG